MYTQETGTQPQPRRQQPPPAAPPPDDDRPVGLDDWERETFKHYGVPENLRRAISTGESGGDVNAVSPTGVKGRYGVTQSTARQYKDANGKPLDRNDPWQQPVAAARYLKDLHDSAPPTITDDKERWLHAVSRYYGGGDAVDGSGILSTKSKDNLSNPYEHTKKIARIWGDLERGSDGSTSSAGAASLITPAPTTGAQPVQRVDYDRQYVGPDNPTPAQLADKRNYTRPYSVGPREDFRDKHGNPRPTSATFEENAAASPLNRDWPPGMVLDAATGQLKPENQLSQFSPPPAPVRQTVTRRTSAKPGASVFQEQAAQQAVSNLDERQQIRDAFNIRPAGGTTAATMADVSAVNRRVPVDPKLRKQSEEYAAKSPPRQFVEDAYYGLARGGQQLQNAAQDKLGMATGVVRKVVEGVPYRPMDIRSPEGRAAQEQTAQTLENERRASGDPWTGEIASAVPVAAGATVAGALGGVPGLAAYNAGLEDWKDPARSTARVAANTLLPVGAAKVAGKVAGPLLERIVSPGARTAATVATEGISAGAVNAAQTAAEQQYFDGQIDPNAVIRAGTVGTVLGGMSALPPSARIRRSTVPPNFAEETSAGPAPSTPPPVPRDDDGRFQQRTSPLPVEPIGTPESYNTGRIRPAARPTEATPTPYDTQEMLPVNLRPRTAQPTATTPRPEVSPTFVPETSEFEPVRLPRSQQAARPIEPTAESPQAAPVAEIAPTDRRPRAVKAQPTPAQELPVSPLFSPEAVVNPGGGIPKLASAPIDFNRLAERQAEGRINAPKGNRTPTADLTIAGVIKRRTNGDGFRVSDRGEARALSGKEGNLVGLVNRKSAYGVDDVAHILNEEGFTLPDGRPFVEGGRVTATEADVLDFFARHGKQKAQNSTGNLEQRLADDEAAYYQNRPETGDLEPKLAQIELQERAGEIDAMEAQRERNRLGVDPQYTEPTASGREPLDAHSPYLTGATIERDGAVHIVRNAGGEVLSVNANKQTAIRNASDAIQGSGDYAIDENGRSVYAPDADAKGLTPGMRAQMDAIDDLEAAGAITPGFASRERAHLRFSVGQSAGEGHGQVLGAGFGAFQNLFTKRPASPTPAAPAFTPPPRLPGMTAGQLPRTSVLDTVSALRKAGLLTGVKTHLRNLGGNAAYQAFDEVAKLPASLVDLAVSAVTGQRTITAPSAKAVGRAGYEAATKGVREAAQILRKGATQQQLSHLQLHNEINTGSKILDAYVNGTFRTLAAEDVIFKTFALRRSLESRAKAQALTEVRQGKITRKDVASRTDQLVQSPTADMQAGAVADAEVSTFNNDNALNTAISAGRRELRNTTGGKAADVGIDMVMPFSKTPTNIIARTLEASPLGYGKNTVQLARAIANKSFTPEQQRAFAQTFGRATAGTVLIALGYKLAADGQLTGAYSNDPKDRALAQSSSRPPASLRVGGHWFSVASFAPLGSLLVIGASLHESHTKGGSAVGATINAARETVKQQPLLQASSDIGDAFKNEAGMNRKLGSIAGSFVPTFVSDIADAADTNARKATGFSEQIMRRIPGLRNSLPAARDPFGRPVPHSRWAAVDPFSTKPVDVSPVTEELQRLSLGFTQPGRRRGESGQDYDQRLQHTGEAFLTSAAELISSPEYRDATRQERADTLRMLYREHASGRGDDLDPIGLIDRVRVKTESPAKRRATK